MVVAAFSFRYDAHLVPALIENIAPSVHAWVSLDDRGATAGLSDEPARRLALLYAARNLGAKWILAPDPDERFEDALRDRIDALTGGGDALWLFRCREMHSPTAYRTDGLWGGKEQVRLFSLHPDALPDAATLHGRWTSNPSKAPVRSSRLNFYHLRMITPERRQLRRDTYAAADPGRRFQKIGYDYICDERGMVLEEIPPGRGYSPLHFEDGGLWGPKAGAIGTPVPDPFVSRMRYVRQSHDKGGVASASHVAQDLARARPEDSHLSVHAAFMALRADHLAEAEAMIQAARALYPDMILAHFLSSRLALRKGDRAAARLAAEATLAQAPGSLIAQQQWYRTLLAAESLPRPDALWRRWLKGPASWQEGAEVAPARMAVVVIGHRAPAELAAAVQSLRDQDEAAEIVVVNSGGGPARRILKPHLDHIRLIEVEEPLFVGAARNIGIDASDAPFVAFLASDCMARQGWVRSRMQRHDAGAAAVASAVVAFRPTSLTSIAASCVLHRNRWPKPRVDQDAFYGLSYSRAVFDDWGYFPTGLRVAEDTAVNRLIRGRVRVDWAPEVVTAHRYPTNPLRLIQDMFARGRRRTGHPPVGDLGLAADADAAATVAFLAGFRLNWALEGLAEIKNLSAPRRHMVRRLIYWAIRADQRGTMVQLPDLKQGHELSVAAAGRALTDPAAATVLWAKAAALCPQNWTYRHRLAQSALQSGTLAERRDASDALQAAMALAPDQPQPFERMWTQLIAENRVAEAADLAERAALMWPDQRGPWLRAHAAAMRTGAIGRACLIAQLDMVRRPEDPDAHDYLARSYRRSGNDSLAEMREAMARDLRATDPKSSGRGQQA